MLEIIKAHAQTAEEAAREAYTVDAKAEDASQLADGAVRRLAEGMAELGATMKLRLRWALKRAGRTETVDWREKFAVPEGDGRDGDKGNLQEGEGRIRRQLEEAGGTGGGAGGSGGGEGRAGAGSGGGGRA